VTKRLRTRQTVRELIPTAEAMSSSSCPLWANKRMRAWAIRRAAALPLLIKFSNRALSSSARFTRYFSIAVLDYLPSVTTSFSMNEIGWRLTIED
jgi:hypothetical protein